MDFKNHSPDVRQHRRLDIPCLLPCDKLEDLCYSQGLIYTGRIQYLKAEFEVENILDDCEEQGTHWYLIHWKGYPESEATWEPEDNLSRCQAKVESYLYHKRLIEKFHSGGIDFLKKGIQKIFTSKPRDVASLFQLCALCGIDEPNEYQISKVTFLALRQKIANIFNLPKKRFYKTFQKNLQSIVAFANNRVATMERLQHWENKMNASHSGSPLRVQNNIDCEGPPPFIYISDYVYVGFKLKEEFILGCECQNCDYHQDACCPRLANVDFAYNKFGSIRLKPGYPIYECNKLCKCGPNCNNRIVQKGSKVKFEIFRTKNSRGWGLRTLQNLRKGQFVLEYIGEVITSEAADKRRYADEDSYLFDLDFEVSDNKYTVDAKHMGNAAHFINHSCDPNMNVFAVWINHLDNHLPRLAFFTKREIKSGEELTFDYRMNKESNQSSPQVSPLVSLKASQQLTPQPRSFSVLNGSLNSSASTSVSSSQDEDRILCLCQSSKCRGYLF